MRVVGANTAPINTISAINRSAIVAAVRDRHRRHRCEVVPYADRAVVLGRGAQVA